MAVGQEGTGGDSGLRLWAWDLVSDRICVYTCVCPRTYVHAHRCVLVVGGVLLRSPTLFTRGRLLDPKRRCCFNLTEGGLPRWLSSKESTCNAGATRDAGSIPGLRRSLGGGHGNPLQYSCLENPMDRGAWQAMVPSVTKSWT